MLVSVVIPCYNSEKSIGKLVDMCMEAFSKWDGYECEMVLVNDCSRDGTYREILKCVERYPGKVTGVDFSKNFGQHAALLAAMHYVRGEIVVGMDDDLQNHPDQILQFLDKMEEGYDVVFGVYRKRQFGWFKNLTSKISQFLMVRLVERPKGIDMSNFWCARRFVTDEMIRYQGNDALVQPLFARTTSNMADISLEHYEREFGTSNYSFKKAFRLFMTFMDYSTVPLRIANFFGILFSLAGFVATIALIIHKFVDPTVQTGWSSLMCLMLIIAGIVFLMLGVIGEYLGKLISASTNKPLFVVRDVRRGENPEEASVDQRPSC
ncbi:MAG TPA: glycosyltransferase [Lachnospiraceae bacterium]|nr:glycosyltransferase [Lachnospiraceae bacterium]